VRPPSKNEDATEDKYSEPYFYQSKAFTDAIREDVNTLLSAFSSAWTAASVDPAASPFVTFKTVWRSTGWVHIHLNTIEPALREAWWTVVARSFTGRSAAEI
jgi:hypothetical protein